MDWTVTLSIWKRKPSGTGPTPVPGPAWIGLTVVEGSILLFGIVNVEGLARSWATVTSRGVSVIAGCHDTALGGGGGGGRWPLVRRYRRKSTRMCGAWKGHT